MSLPKPSFYYPKNVSTQGYLPNTSMSGYIPSSNIHSDYLPTNIISDLDGVSQQWYHQYVEDKRRGRVTSQRPINFNPTRYRSVRVSENVRVNEPISQTQLSRFIHR